MSPKSQKLSCCLGILLLASLMPAAFGFGHDGHLAIGELAFRQLQSGPRATVLRLLQDSKPHTLARSCLWPDEVKNEPGYQWSQPLHYVNLPRGQRQFDQQRDCPDGSCLPAATKRFASELGNLGLADEQRATALKFLCHFVGDLHQPLHTGYADDQGGNLYQVSVRGEGTNLHSVWDFTLVAELGAWPEIVDVVANHCQIETKQTWVPADVMHWFAESRQRVMHDVYPSGHKLNEKYIARFAPLTRQRLCLAGKRLGWLLNSLLTESNQP
jgi:hypothetical protein